MVAVVMSNMREAVVGEGGLGSNFSKHQVWSHIYP